jgi:hypothetical protein
MSAARAGNIEPMGEEIDLPMALTDAELPRPKSASAVPAPISLDSELPMPSDQKDLPIARDDFMDLDGPERVHGGGPVELDLPDGEDLDLEMELDAPRGVPGAPPPMGQPFGSPGAGPSGDMPSADRISRDSGWNSQSFRGRGKAGCTACRTPAVPRRPRWPGPRANPKSKGSRSNGRPG